MNKTTIQTEKHFDNLKDVEEYLINQRQINTDYVQICTCIGEYNFRRRNTSWELIS